MNDTACPLCGGDNHCGAAKGAGTCWCFSTRMPAEVLERVPPAQRGAVCVCEHCATEQTRSAAPPKAAIGRSTRQP